MYVAGTMLGVLIKGGVPISGVVCTLFYVAGSMLGVLIKGGVIITGVSLWRGSTVEGSFGKH